MVPELMFQLTGRNFRSIEAQLPDYKRFTVQGEVYPAVLKAQGVVTKGILYFNVSEPDLKKLDQFEGEIYFPEKVEVFDIEGKKEHAIVYCLKDDFKHLKSSIDWDFDYFLRHHLKNFLWKVVTLSLTEY